MTQWSFYPQKWNLLDPVLVFLSTEDLKVDGLFSRMDFMTQWLISSDPVIVLLSIEDFNDPAITFLSREDFNDAMPWSLLSREDFNDLVVPLLSL